MNGRISLHLSEVMSSSGALDASVNNRPFDHEEVVTFNSPTVRQREMRPRQIS